MQPRLHTNNYEGHSTAQHSTRTHARTHACTHAHTHTHTQRSNSLASWWDLHPCMEYLFFFFFLMDHFWKIYVLVNSLNIDTSHDTLDTLTPFNTIYTGIVYEHRTFNCFDCRENLMQWHTVIHIHVYLRTKRL